MKTENEFNPRVNFEQQLEMYKQIDKSTFNKIWYFQKSWPHKEQKDTLKNISFRPENKYFEFLEKCGKDNKAVNYYSDTFKASGDISPSMNASLIMQYELYDISDIRTKLIIAIHYLTLNDQNWRKEKY
ncbi:MAG: hypothetical protein Q8S44_04370 [Flavobacteriaceae bacterium]|nr:hypothetical protein [Flavobacteriaceae bacterium]